MKEELEAEVAELTQQAQQRQQAVLGSDSQWTHLMGKIEMANKILKLMEEEEPCSDGS